jgi:integrase
VHGRYATVLNPKTGDSYKVPLSSRARAALDTLTRKGLHVFWHRRLAKNARDWRGSVEFMFARACKAAGVPYGLGRGVTFHGLRHTGASRMVENGTDLRTVQDIGGWKNLRQLSRYTHPTDSAKQRAVEQIGGGKSRQRARERRTDENTNELTT